MNFLFLTRCLVFIIFLISFHSQNVQRRNATKLLLSREDQKPTVQGWVTKVKNGHTKRCWAVLLGKMFLYFKAPGELVIYFYVFFSFSFLMIFM